MADGYPYPPAGYKAGGSDVVGNPPSQAATPRGRVSIPTLLRAVLGIFVGEVRPAIQEDGGSVLFGLPQSEGRVPLQQVSWFGSIANRDRAPMPEEVILPVAMLGDHTIPLETPVYDRGSIWRNDEWERGT